MTTMNDDSNNSIDVQNLVIFSQDEVLMKGLPMLGWKEERLNCVQRAEENIIEQRSTARAVRLAAAAQLADDFQSVKCEGCSRKTWSLCVFTVLSSKRD